MSTSFPQLPLGSALIPMEATYGIVLVAVIFSAFLTGILTLQLTSYYALFPKDSMIRKSLAAGIYVLDIAHFACIADFAWWYLVRNWGNVDAVAIIRPTYGLYVVFSTLIISIVQLVFLHRILRLDRRMRYFCFPMLVFILIEFAFGMIGASFGITVKPFTDINIHAAFPQIDVAMWLGSGVIVDIGIATVLYVSLQRRKTGFKRTDTILTKLKVYAINTCALTSVVAVIDIVAYYNQDHVYNLHLGCNMILCKLFSNSLLASWNRRAEFSAGDHINTTTSITGISTGISIETHTEQQTFDEDGRSIQYDAKNDLAFGQKPESHWNVEMFPVPKAA